MSFRPYAKASVLAFVLSLAWLAAAEPPAETALDRYIAKPDPAYGWTVAKTLTGEGYTAWVLDLKSQTWRSKAEVDRPIWQHWLTIVKPNGATANTGLLYIGGGANGKDAPDKPGERALSLALGTKTVTADLGQVPNQPLYFADSPKQDRAEDDLIAYSRVKYFITHDDEWLVRLAMVKSAVAAITAIQEFMASDAGGKLALEHFVVAGGSKRGWTTWLTGIVDPRVTAIMPIVIDALNSQQITKHHFEAYGFFSPALGDYVAHSLFPYAIGTPDYQHIMEIEDAYNYFNRPKVAQMPKYLVNASGDQFFLPDNSHQYYSEIPGEKYIRYVENAKHNLQGSDAGESLLAFYSSIVNNTKRPKFSFTLEPDGPIRVTVEDMPKEVNLWQATNPNARDFRVDTIGKAYTKTPLTLQEGKTYIGQVDKPEKGYTAFYVELVYDSGGPTPFKFTSEVNVVPDILPYKWEDAFKKK
jgi:PhoPQ-activated pathogenicity-related protein